MKCRDCGKYIDEDKYPLSYGICEDCIEKYLPPPISEEQKKINAEWEMKCDMMNLNNDDRRFYYTLNMSPNGTFHIFRLPKKDSEPRIFNAEIANQIAEKNLSWLARFIKWIFQ